jgi:hypothetical protein
LLLRFSGAAARGAGASALVQLFCREVRDFFQVSGVYFWRSVSPEEMLGEEADGLSAERFRGLRLQAGQSAVTAEAIRLRRAVFVNWRLSFRRGR